MTPVASKPIVGTPWHEVRTDTGHVYWFNPSTQESVWEMPEDVRNLKDTVGTQPARVHGRDDAEAGKRGSRPGDKASRRKQPISVDAKTMAAMRRAKANGAVLAPEYEELLAKELAEQAARQGGKRKKSKKENKDATGKKRKKERVGAEKGEAAPAAPAAGGGFDEFDVEFDEEDILGDQDDPGAQGGEWSKEKIEEGFRSLLREHGVHEFSRYELVERKIGGDPRFVAVADSKRRKIIFEEFCAGVGVVEGGANEREHRADGPGHVGSEPKATSAAAFRALLQEKVKDHRKRWDDVVSILEEDPRFAEGPHSLQAKQALFDDHQIKLANAARRRADSNKLYEKDLLAAERRQAQHSRRDAGMNFATLLAEVVRVPGTFEEVVESLRADPQGRMLDDEATARDLHSKHVSKLREVALERLSKLYEARGWDKHLTFDQVGDRLDEDLEFFGFSKAMQEEAWNAYTAGNREERNDQASCIPDE